MIPIIGALLRGIGGAAITSGGRGMVGSGIRFISGLPRLLGEREGASEPTSDIESMRQSFVERMQAGEEISDDELADAPAGAVPDELYQRRFSARFNRILTSAAQPGGVSAPSGSNSAQPSGSAGGQVATQAGQPGPAGPAGPPGPQGQIGPMGPAGAGGSPPSGLPPSPGSPEPGGQPPNQVGGGIAAAFSAVTSSVGGFAGVAIRATTVVTGLVRGLELMNTGVLALNRGLSEYEGGLAAAYAQFDVDEIRRGRERAETMSGPLQALLREQSDLRDGISDVSNQISAGFVQIQAATTRGVNYIDRIFRVTESIAGAIEYIRSKFGMQGSGQIPAWQSFLADVSDGKFDQKRPEFGGKVKSVDLFNNP
jgi:hypothetical protein